MKKLIDLHTWNRKDHFEFFSRFEEPFFGITVQVDCTRAYALSKKEGLSFFLYYLHKTLCAANEIEPFRYRIEKEQVIVYDTVHASPTINRPDGTFGFSYIDYHPDFAEFVRQAQPEIDKVKNTTGLIPAVSGENVIHFSSVPWISFTSLSHARAFSFNDSIPKISVGKMQTTHGISTMPVSIHVHHGLMDGYHVSKFIDLLQERLQNG